MDFEWDEAKRASNLMKHGVDFATACDMDWESATIVPDQRFLYPEPRFWAFGLLNGRLHMVAIARPTAERIRIISFRKASRKEERRYGAKKNKTD